MLKKVDPSNPVLEDYLLSTKTNDGLGILLSKTDEGSSKKPRKLKIASTPEKTYKETIVCKYQRNSM